MANIMLEAYSHRSYVIRKDVNNKTSVVTFLFNLGGEDGKRKPEKR